MLSVEHLRFWYKPGRDVLRDISFSVKQGDILCLLGPNGTGKTTLLRCLLGLSPARGGSVTLDGQPLDRLSHQARAKQLAYVPQSTTLAFPYEAREVVLMGRVPHLPPGASYRKEDRQAVAEAMEQLQITHLARRQFQELSGGERQMVLVARAYSFLRECGAFEVRELTSCPDFEHYQRMAASRLNLVLMQMGQYAAKRMEARLGIPWLFLPATYDLEQIDANYQSIANALGQPCPDLRPYRQAAQRAVSGALECVGDLPVVVDSSATMQPFALAAALHRYGFHVAAVYAAHWKESDRADRLWLEANCPSVRILCSERYQDITDCGLSRKILTIGYDSAYLLRSRHFVDIQRDEGLFGYYGVIRLMERMGDAALRITTWR